MIHSTDEGVGIEKGMARGTATACGSQLSLKIKEEKFSTAFLVSGSASLITEGGSSTYITFLWVTGCFIDLFLGP